MTAARDVLREQRRRMQVTGSSYPRASVVVRGHCAESLELSGAIDAYVSWSGEDGASHSGGLAVPFGAVEPVTDPAVRKLLPTSAAGMVRQVNLSALGLNASSIGKLRPHHYPGGDAQINFFLFEGSGQAELFWDGEPMHLARYPNSPDDQLLIPQNSMHIAAVTPPAKKSHSDFWYFSFGVELSLLLDQRFLRGRRYTGGRMAPR